MTNDEQFVAAAIRRMYLWMAGFAVTAAIALLAWKGWWYAGGFAAGAALSILNFHWLKAAIDGFVGLAVAAPAPRPDNSVLIVKWVLRYALIAAVGYVIFRSSAVSMIAFLGGLFIFVAGVLAEMIYELAAGTGADASE